MTKIGMKRTEPRKPLQRKSPLKRTKGLNRISPKQAKRNRVLSKIAPPTDSKCEKCHELPDWRGLAKHHIMFRSHNGGDERNNILWLCGKCHSEAHGIKEVLDN